MTLNISDQPAVSWLPFTSLTVAGCGLLPRGSIRARHNEPRPAPGDRRRRKAGRRAADRLRLQLVLGGTQLAAGLTWVPKLIQEPSGRDSRGLIPSLRGSTFVVLM